MRFLRGLAKFVSALVLLAVLVVAGFTAWLYFYTAGLPDISAPEAFSPSSPTVVSTSSCAKSIHVVALPSADVKRLRLAVLAAEGEYDLRSVFRRYYDALNSNAPGHRTYSEQLARDAFCEYTGNNLKRQFAEIHAAVQLEHNFTPDQIRNIYTNRVYFGPDIYGAENAAQHYFGKGASQLSTAEAALLAGLIRGPSRFSPDTHPDRALGRRNEVIDAMARQGSITLEDAEVSKRDPLGILRP